VNKLAGGASTATHGSSSSTRTTNLLSQSCQFRQHSRPATRYSNLMQSDQNYNEESHIIGGIGLGPFSNQNLQTI